MLNIKKIPHIELLTAVVGIGMFWFFFNLNVITILALIGGILFTLALYVVREKFKIGSNTASLVIAVFAVAMLLVVPVVPSLITAILIGSNLAMYYLHLKTSTNKLFVNLSVFNTVVLSFVVLLSAIEKFRGSNKLIDTDIETTIPLIIVSGIVVYFLTKLLRTILTNEKKFRYHIIIVASIVLVACFYLISLFLYKEVGTSLLFIPLLGGLAAGMLDAFDENEHILKSLIQIFFIIMLPYSVTGLLGVLLAFLGYFIYQAALNGKKGLDLTVVIKISPLVFLFAAAELRENSGQITRFNTVEGFQIGWILISYLIYLYIFPTFEKLKAILKENESENLFPFVASFFTILILTIIIKFGRDSALAAFILSGSLFLILVNRVLAKSEIDKAGYIFGLTSFIGSLAFYVLTKT